MKKLNYHVWIDADGKHIPVQDMSSSYIQNCTKEIERLLHTIRDYSPSKCDDNTRVFDLPWLYYHGENYLNVFRHELKIRKRIAKKDYPKINLAPSCETCDNMFCHNQGTVCENWTPRDIVLLRALDNEEDVEILQRTGHYCLQE